MYCKLYCAMLTGLEALPVVVEADAANGMPMFAIVGHVSTQVKEAQERVRTALKNISVVMPPKRITVNLSPGDVRKEGTRFDLPIAAGVLGAIGRIDPKALSGVMVLGELHLDGSVGKISGVLPSVICAKEAGCRACIVPAANRREAEIVGEIPVFGIRTLSELVDFCETGTLPAGGEENTHGQKKKREAALPDFSDIRGQPSVKRCALIAAAGFHNMLMTGPPGSGKSMAARRLPGIMPDLSEDEKLELSKIYSIAGLLPEEEPLFSGRPFRAPHHSLTAAALCGGGKYPRPGEITLAHRGVLFLDELPEMKRNVLEMLRQPLEDRCIRISRQSGSFLFPASFLLVGAMNPCPCGHFPDRTRCRCSREEIRAYKNRISRALMDRIDIQCEILAVSYDDLSGGKTDEISSSVLKKQVDAAFSVQKERYRGTEIHFNSEIGVSEIGKYCPVTEKGEKLLRTMFGRMGLSARGYHHVLRVARTIADLDREDMIGERHISEALCYRTGL